MAYLKGLPGTKMMQKIRLISEPLTYLIFTENRLLILELNNKGSIFSNFIDLFDFYTWKNLNSLLEILGTDV